MAEAARRGGARAIVVAAASAAEAALVDGVGVIPLERLEQLQRPRRPERAAAPAPEPPVRERRRRRISPTCAGQPALRRALEVAAAGGHSLLITGPPGAGKSMAARRLPSILPPLGPGEAIDAARVASACGRPVEAGDRRPPTVPRSPPHDLDRRPDRRRQPAPRRAR